MGDRSQPRRNPAGRAFVNHTTRREFLKDAALAGAAVSTFSLAEGSLLSAAGQGNSIDDSSIARKNAVQLAWVGAQPPAMPTGISWGVPFAQGAVRPNTTFALNAAGAALPLQSWPMAYWPDGSLKWSGFATVAPAAQPCRCPHRPEASSARASRRQSAHQRSAGEQGTARARGGTRQQSRFDHPGTPAPARPVRCEGPAGGHRGRSRAWSAASAFSTHRARTSARSTSGHRRSLLSSPNTYARRTPS